MTQGANMMTLRSQNRLEKLILFSLLVFIGLGMSFFLFVSIYPFKILTNTLLKVQLPEDGDLHPGDHLNYVFTANKSCIAGTVSRHETQLILDNGWIINYEEHAGKLEENAHCEERGFVTLPKGRIVENRKAKLRFIYTFNIMWKPADSEPFSIGPLVLTPHQLQQEGLYFQECPPGCVPVPKKRRHKDEKPF